MPEDMLQAAPIEGEKLTSQPVLPGGTIAVDAETQHPAALGTAPLDTKQTVIRRAN